MALQRWREAFGSVAGGIGYQIHLKQIRFLSFSQNGPKKKIHQEEEGGYDIHELKQRLSKDAMKMFRISNLAQLHVKRRKNAAFLNGVKQSQS